MSKATYTRSIGTDWITVTFPFDGKYVETIKALIPANERSWNPSTKEWSIPRFYKRAIEDAFNRIDQQRHTPPPRQQPTNSAVRNLEDILVDLFQALPVDIRPKAHRALVRSVHPDAGGNHELAVSLNRAWDRVGEAVAA